jgi:dolichyl-diphosphooligosaccharide--protein glycosyltransferase
MIQMRFMVMGAIGIAWAAGWLVARAWEAGEAKPGRRWLEPAALAALAVCLLFPHAKRPIDSARLAPDADQLALAGALGTLGEPPAGAGSKPAGAPPGRGLARWGVPHWGVIAPWDMGHLLVYEGNAPVIACPFGQAPWHVEGVRREVRFSLSPSDEDAAALCRKLRARYVVTGDPFSRILSNARILGVPSNRYVARGPETGVDALPDFAATIGFRLHLLDGAATTAGDFEVPAAPHFRLVWESPGLLDRALRITGARDVRPSTYKLFEVVEGARVRGRCVQGGPVRLRVRARTNMRSFDWVNEAPCVGGRFEMRVPYASGGAHLGQGPREREVAVSDAQVRAGDVVSANADGS